VEKVVVVQIERKLAPKSLKKSLMQLLELKR
jgi:hypothetical protein